MKNSVPCQDSPWTYHPSIFEKDGYVNHWAWSMYLASEIFSIILQYDYNVLNIASLLKRANWVAKFAYENAIVFIEQAGSTLYSEGSFVWMFFSPKPFEVAMVRRTYGPKVFIPKFLYSESCNVPKIPYSERPSTIWILCYEDSLVRSSSSLVYSTVYSDADHRKHQSSVWLAPAQKWPVTRKIFPFDDVIMLHRADGASTGTI